VDSQPHDNENTPANDNPYAAPVPLSPAGVNPHMQLQPVAIVLMATSIPWTGLLLLSALAQLPGIIHSFQHEPFSMAAGTTFGTVLPVLWSATVAYGATLMYRMRRYSSARLSAVLAMAPVCGPCFVLGIPLGIWALVILHRKEVRAAFVD
jgi:hypothetical protein